jgi:hypothetical protein
LKMSFGLGRPLSFEINGGRGGTLVPRKTAVPPMIFIAFGRVADRLPIWAKRPSGF